MRVPPFGPIDAKIVFIGEAPGAEEIKYGMPFIGPAGVVLKRLLSKSHIHKAECYFTNVVKERPRNNDIKPFINLTKKNPILSESYKRYEEELFDELSRLDHANVFVPLGNTALFALTKLRGITDHRGSIYTIPIGGRDRKVIATLHPAALLPNRGKYVMRYPVIQDLQRIRREAEFPDRRKIPNNITLAPSYYEVMNYLNSLKSGNTIGFDIEVSNMEVSCISFSHEENQAICIPFQTGIEHYFRLDQEVAIWKRIGEILSDKSINKIAQNAAFDANFLFTKFGIVTEPLDDTLIQHSILFPELPKSLGFLTSLYTDEVFYKDIGRRIFTEGNMK